MINYTCLRNDVFKKISEKEIGNNQAALNIGIEKNTLSRFLNDKVKKLDIYTFYRITRWLKVPMDKYNELNCSSVISHTPDKDLSNFVESLLWKDSSLTDLQKRQLSDMFRIEYTKGVKNESYSS